MCIRFEYRLIESIMLGSISLQLLVECGLQYTYQKLIRVINNIETVLPEANRMLPALVHVYQFDVLLANMSFTGPYPRGAGGETPINYFASPKKYCERGRSYKTSVVRWEGVCPIRRFFGEGGLQMRKSALFGAKKSDFSKFMVYPHGQRGED